MENNTNNKITLMQRIARDNGTIALLSSIVLSIVGAYSKNYTLLMIGGIGFASMVLAYIMAIKVCANIKKKQAETDHYIAKKDFELKADLLAKAYGDGKITDEDISYLVRSLARPVANNSSTVNATESIPVVSNTVEPVVRPIVVPIANSNTKVIEETIEEASEEVEVINEEVQVIESSDESSVPEISQFTVNGGKFCFRYNGKDMTISPADVVKRQYLHEEFDDSIGYYQSPEATFYIYPADRKIVAVKN